MEIFLDKLTLHKIIAKFHLDNNRLEAQVFMQEQSNKEEIGL